ncbi:MAG: hypothetical protein CMI36_14690 [Owenweeksia sp.]|nr:hypothetical protein [Owenweeksia sp.]MBG00238.1 hypothetical protein [Owenweeksia sp.]|tara:strand:+ start:1239 stop:1676 length:438 start_codon:yes stop_codon:yes gene_type:complete
MAIGISNTALAQTDSVEVTSDATAQYSDALLASFGRVHEKAETIQRQYRQEMIKAVEETGLSADKFSGMLNYKKDVTSDASDYTSEEKKAFMQAMKSIVEIQDEMNSEVKKLIEATGLTLHQYNSMAGKYAQSREMRRQVRSLQE